MERRPGNGEQDSAEILNRLPGVVCQLRFGQDDSLSFTYCSPTIQELCGLSPEALSHSAERFFAHVHSGDRERMREELLESTHVLTPWNREFRFRNPGRGEVWLEARFAPTRDADDSTLLHGVLLDITARKKDEQALRESEEQYRLMFQQMLQAVSVHDIVQDKSGKVIDYVFVDGNASLERTFGLKMNDIRGASIRQINPHVSEEIMKALGEVALTGEPYVQDYYSARADRDFEVLSYSPRRGRFASIHMDITDRKRAQESLKEKNRILDALNKYSLEQADCRTPQGLAEMITRQLMDYADPVVVTFNEYDPVKKALVIKHVRTDQKLLNMAVGLLGDRISSIDVPISEEILARMASSFIWYHASLTEVTDGAIPESISAVMQRVAGVECFLVFALVIDSYLHATMVMGLKDKQHAPALEFLEPFAYLSCISLRRTQAEERLRHISYHDQLTGMYNRHYLEEEMERIDSKENLPLSIIMADLNGLKVINDTYGHLHGDEMLKTSAEVIQGCCRKGDIVARWGGDEYIVLMPQTDARVAEDICKMITARSRLAAVKSVPVSVSLGTATKTREHQVLTKVLRDAEDDMYKNKLSESSSARSSVLSALLKALEEKSYETEAHTRRMQDIAMKIGESIGLSESELGRLMLVITLHDIGKINIPEEMLTRRGPLTPEEWKIMKTHPEVGSRIARATNDFSHVANDILSHHERWDGKGYPQGLKGREIPLLARVTALADAYEVMTNGRPYRAALSHLEVVTELKACSGSQFDPELVEAFIGVLRDDSVRP